MSQLLGGTRLVERDDRRLVLMEYQNEEPPQDFSSPWWPQGGQFQGEQGVYAPLLRPPDWYEYPELTSGVASRLTIIGVTRDVYGSPLAACTVRAFRTSDGAMLHETVSDANGNYVTSIFDGAAYFLVFYKAGVPDVFGTTVNTLVGS